MALSSDYTAGTISVSANGTAVTGAGTAWQISGFKSGDLFFADGWFSVVASVESNTALTLEAPWRGGALTGATYFLRRASENAAVAEQARKLITLLGGSGNLEALGGLVGVAGSVPVFTGPGTMGLLTRQDLTQGARYDAQVPDIAVRSAFNGEDEGFAVLVGDVGDGRAAIYSRVGAAGNWSAPAYITGPAITLDITEVDEVPYGTPPDVTLTPKAGGYDLAFEIPRGMIIEPGTTTTLAPGQPAAVTFVPITGGYRLDIALPKGDTGDIDGVTPFWVTRLSTDTDAASARAGLGATATGEALFTAADAEAARESLEVVAYVAQSFTPEQKGQARANIDAGILSGFRNKIINGDFTVNQRGASSKAQSVGVYGYDRWKGHADGIEQVIEGLPAGTYTLTFGGGGTGSVGGQTPSVSPAVFTVATGGNISVVVPATATRVSLVPGDATAEDDPFSPRHIQQETALCQRYFERVAGTLGTNTDPGYYFRYSVPKRISPPTLSWNTSPGATITMINDHNMWHGFSDIPRAGIILSADAEL